MIDQAQVMILNVLVVVTRSGYLMVPNAKFYQTFWWGKYPRRRDCSSKPWDFIRNFMVFILNLKWNFATHLYQFMILNHNWTVMNLFNTSATMIYIWFTRRGGRWQISRIPESWKIGAKNVPVTQFNSEMWFADTPVECQHEWRNWISPEGRTSNLISKQPGPQKQTGLDRQSLL